MTGTSGDDTEPGTGYQMPQFYLPQQLHLIDSNGFLSQPSLATPRDVAMAYLQTHAGALNLDATDISTAITTTEYRSDTTGMSHFYLQQSRNGLEVLNAVLNINVNAIGQVMNVGASFVPGLNSTVYAGLPTTPTISAIEAVASAASELDLTDATTSTLVSAATDVDLASVLTGGNVSQDDISANLVYVPTGEGEVVLAWELVIRPLDGLNWYNAAVDATTGDLVYLANWSNNASYEGYQSPSVKNPNDGPRTVIMNPADLTASPFGWHDTDGAAGPEFTDTRGNNVFAQEDRDGDDAGGFRPSGGASLDFAAPIDFTQDPSTYQAASIINLFYVANVLHDVHFKYGFNEVSGNFQFTNYSGQGLGGDEVQADAQDSVTSGPFGPQRNNANMQVPPDGRSPILQMYLWNRTPVERDGDLDNQIIAHEYGHGVSVRLTGGPANSSALSAVQSAGMGEGWSDFFALMMGQKATDTLTTSQPLANYSMGQPQTGGGLRSVPYNFDMTIDPLTMGSYNSIPPALPFPRSVHRTGEIWASVLWDMNMLLVQKYGFSANLASGYSQGAAGNILAMQLVHDGLKLQPANPSFLDARDAILLADRNLTNGANQGLIWAAFGRRGMGTNADDGGGSNAINVTPGTAAPTAIDDTVPLNGTNPLTINVLANDFDLDGINTSTVTIVAQPSNGTVSVGPTGVVTYTPNSAGVPDMFTYTFRDTLGNTSNVATVNLSVLLPPVAVADTASTPVATPVTIDVVSNDTDADGNVLASSVAIVAQPTNGSATVNGTTGEITYTPRSNFSGTDTLTYTIRDNDGLVSQPGTVTITVTTSIPIAGPDSATVAEDSSVVIDVLANDSDSDGTIDATSVAIASAPAHGSTQINPTTGAVTYTPTANYFGSDSFTYTVKDNTGAISNAAAVNINVTPVNDPPVANNDTATTNEDVAVNIPVLNNDTDIEGGLLPTGIVITTTPANGTAVVDLVTGQVVYTPALDYSGSDSFRYAVRDSNGALSNTATVSVSINSVNDAPRTIADVRVATAGAPLLIDVLANDTDPDGTINVGSLTIVQPPLNGTAVIVSGQIQYTPNPGFVGGDGFLYTVRDNTGLVSLPTPVLIRVGPAVSISGYAYVDLNQDGVKTTNEIGIPNTPITLTKNDNGFSFSRTVVTDSQGFYQFVEDANTILPAGTYELSQVQPGFFVDGFESVGTINGVRASFGWAREDAFGPMTLAPGDVASNFNFGEQSLRPEFVTAFFNRQTLFASSAPTANTVNVQTNSFWMSFDSGWQGNLAAVAKFDPSKGNATLSLYDANMNLVASSVNSSTQANLNYTGTPGEVYFLKVSGTNPTVDLQTKIVNSVTTGWHNATNGLDVNRDGFITSIDLVYVASTLNSLTGSSSVFSVSNPSSIAADTNNDGYVTAMDLLLVVDRLNTAGGASLAVAPLSASLSASDEPADDSSPEAIDAALVELALEDWE